MSFIKADKPRQVDVAGLSPRQVSRDRLYDFVALAIFVVAGLLIAFTFRDYSISTDEEVQSTYGRLLRSFYLSGLTDTRAFGYYNLYLYGGLFDLIAALIEPFSPFSDFDTRHLLCTLFGIFGVLATWRLARHLAGPRAGLWAVILLMLCPPFYGAMFNNTKDIPFAVGMTWMLYLSCRLIASLPRPPWRLVAWLGLATGATLGLRVGAVLGGLYLLPVFALQAIGVGKRRGWPASARFLRTSIARLLPALAIAIAVMAVLWPWSAMAPGNILLAVRDLTAFHVPTILGGRPFDSYNVPGSYLPTYVLLKLPEITLVGLSAAVVAGAAAFLPRSDRLLTSTKAQQWLLVVMAVLVPLLYAIVARPAIYNGLRHFLFIVPPLCVLAAAGIEQLLNAARRLAGRWLAIAVVIVLAAGVIKDVATMTMLHPHQYLYYNLLAGGVRGANDGYEMDYWSNFMREAIAELTEYVAAENGGRLPDRTFSVDLCTSPWPLRAYAPRQFRMTEDCRSADFFISTTNTNCHRGCDGKTIIEVERMGVVLGVVKDRRDRAAPPEATHLSYGGR